MEQTQTSIDEPTSPPHGELVRPLGGRMVAGVALAISRRLELPDWVIRVAFIVTAFMGGLGVILYGAGWALIRSETEAEPAAERFFARAGTMKSWIGIGFIAVAALIVFGQFSVFNDGFTWAAALLVVGLLLYSGVVPTPTRASSDDDPSPDPGDGPVSTTQPASALATATPPVTKSNLPPPPAPTPRPPREPSYLGRLTIGIAMLSLGVLAVLDIAPVDVQPRPRHYLALLAVVMGAALLVGTFRGRARFLILIGLILVPALFVSPLLERGAPGSWSRSYSPTSFADVQPSYRIDVGSLDVDLTDLPWDGEEVAVHIEGNGAAIRVWVPFGTAVRGRLDANVGWLRSDSGASGGIRPTPLFLDIDGGDPAWGTLRLDGRVDIGTIHVIPVYMDRQENQG